MTIATLRLELQIVNCASAREKERRMRAIMEKVHRHFNVSVAEADHDGDPSRSVLAVVAVGRSRWLVRETLDRVADAVAAYPRARLVSHAFDEI